MSENKDLKKNDQGMEKVAGGAGPDPREVKCLHCKHVFEWTPGTPWYCPKCGSYMS